MEIIEDQDLVNNWLGEIQDKEFYWTQTFLTNFCAISKEGFSKVDYDYDTNTIDCIDHEPYITQHCDCGVFECLISPCYLFLRPIAAAPEPRTALCHGSWQRSTAEPKRKTKQRNGERK